MLYSRNATLSRQYSQLPAQDWPANLSPYLARFVIISEYGKNQMGQPITNGQKVTTQDSSAPFDRIDRSDLCPI